eukprot:UN00685
MMKVVCWLLLLLEKSLMMMLVIIWKIINHIDIFYIRYIINCRKLFPLLSDLEFLSASHHEKKGFVVIF